MALFSLGGLRIEAPNRTLAAQFIATGANLVEASQTRNTARMAASIESEIGVDDVVVATVDLASEQKIAGLNNALKSLKQKGCRLVE